MQAQTELGTPEKLDVKEKTLKSEALKEVGVEVLRLRKQCSNAACLHGTLWDVVLAFSQWLPGPLYQGQSKLHRNSPANYI